MILKSSTNFLNSLLLFQLATGTDRDRPEVPNGCLQHSEDKPREPGEEIHVSIWAPRSWWPQGLAELGSKLGLYMHV